MIRKHDLTTLLAHCVIKGKRTMHRPESCEAGIEDSNFITLLFPIPPLCIFDSWTIKRAIHAIPTLFVHISHPSFSVFPKFPSFCEISQSEMQTLRQKASEWSGVQTDDALAIDDTNLFQKLGLQTFIDLSTNFYNRVYDDEEDCFRSMFASSNKENAIQNQYEFFVQRMGGPPLYSQRRGHPALIARHRPFPVTHQAAERWLHHMQQALNTTPDIDDDSRIKMMNFFRHTIYFLVAGDELKNQSQQMPCKHATGK